MDGRENFMELTRTAYATWSGGSYTGMGEPLSEERNLQVIHHAWERGIRTFLTADVFGQGAADDLLGRALAGMPRNEICLVGAVGHDFYSAMQDGPRGYLRFTHPALRPPNQFAEYLRRATELALARCRVDKFDLLLLQNPDLHGFTSEAVWLGMHRLREAGLTDRIGIAPGPANGYPLDLLVCFARFGALLDGAMIILNPLEPAPANLVLPVAERLGIRVITRAVDGGGLFFDDLPADHQFGLSDSRQHRPAGWWSDGRRRMDIMREVADKHGLTMLQLASLWNLAQPAVRCVAPTFLQESGAGARTIESRIDELGGLPALQLTADESGFMAEISAPTGCLQLKGANPGHLGEPETDRWLPLPDHEAVARRWGIDPAKVLAYPPKPGA